MSTLFCVVLFLLFAICKQLNLFWKCLKYKFNIIHIFYYSVKCGVRNMFEVTLLRNFNFNSTFQFERCKFNKKIMNNGKIFKFIKCNWHYILYVSAFFAGVVCGLRACSKSDSVIIDAYRPRISVEQSKTK